MYFHINSYLFCERFICFFVLIPQNNMKLSTNLIFPIFFLALQVFKNNLVPIKVYGGPHLLPPSVGRTLVLFFFITSLKSSVLLVSNLLLYKVINLSTLDSTNIFSKEHRFIVLLYTVHQPNR